MWKLLSKLLLGLSIILTLSCGIKNTSQRPIAVRSGYVVVKLDDYINLYTWAKTPWYRVSDHEGMMPITIALTSWGNSYAACLVDPNKEYVPYGLPFVCKNGWRLPR